MEVAAAAATVVDNSKKVGGRRGGGGGHHRRQRLLSTEDDTTSPSSSSLVVRPRDSDIGVDGKLSESASPLLQKTPAAAGASATVMPEDDECLPDAAVTLAAENQVGPNRKFNTR